MYTTGVFKSWLHHLVTPTSKNRDQARREFILNVLLVGSITLTLFANLWTWFGELTASPQQRHGFEGTSIQLIIILFFFIGALFLSKKGKARIVSYVLVFLYVGLASLTASRWGVSIPENLLIYAFTIVMAGILVGARFSFFISGLILTLLLTILYLQDMGTLTLNTAWRFKLATYGDVIIYGITLFLIAVVSWLFNRELERSEADLEIKVEERTRELKRSQAEQLTQMYQFSEFGKLASGLFHDLVNPLTTVSLNLESLHSKKDLKEMHELLESARAGTKQLEGFLGAARKQIQQQKTQQQFTLQEEIDQALQMLHYKARENQVKVEFHPGETIYYFGDPVKFYQVILNLVSNAIDAHEGNNKQAKTVQILLEKKNKEVILQIKDNGKGIPKAAQSKIFEPLFTTKKAHKGIGMGLSIVKGIVMNELKGTIDIKSKSGETTFTIIFPLISKKI